MYKFEIIVTVKSEATAVIVENINGRELKLIDVFIYL